jgi:hypothetical protein
MNAVVSAPLGGFVNCVGARLRTLQGWSCIRALRLGEAGFVAEKILFQEFAFLP